MHFVDTFYILTVFCVIYLQLDPFTDEHIIRALSYVISLDGTQNEVDIINMSFGGHGEISEALNLKLVEVALIKTIVVAAGRILFSYFFKWKRIFI